MYTKPIFYKIYSIVIFAFAVLSSVGSVLFAVFGASKLNRVLPVGSWASYLAVLIGTSLASLFFSYGYIRLCRERGVRNSREVR